MAECTGGGADEVTDGIDSAQHSHAMDKVAVNIAQALEKEGLPKEVAHRMSLIVISHIANEGDEARTTRVTFRRKNALSKWWFSFIANVIGATAVAFLAVPLIKQLSAGGFGPAAGLVASALALVVALAAYRLSTQRRVAKTVTIRISLPKDSTAEETPRHQVADSTFEPSDVGTFANAVGRVADRDGTYAIG